MNTQKYHEFGDSLHIKLVARYQLILVSILANKPPLYNPTNYLDSLEFHQYNNRVIKYYGSYIAQ